MKNFDDNNKCVAHKFYDKTKTYDWIYEIKNKECEV